ncbi:MAG TPA: NAD(+)/NADH kinase [bacterium]|nr:NAD(+)/NADH kinase [bacterium]
MINSVFILENKKIEGIEKEKEKTEDIVRNCGKVVEKDIKNVDFLITMGGDGTILKGFHLLENKETLIYGIKYGKVGFLTNSNENIEEKLKKVFAGNFYVSERTLLEIEIRSGNEFYKDICLNEIVVFRKGIRIINLSVETEKEKVLCFRADGIICSTPTGSTGHSLSAGGPILDPEIISFLIIPLMPHLLTTRPVILGKKDRIKISINGKVGIVIDGQKEYITEENSEINVFLSEKKGKIVLEDKKFFEKLSSKFHWSK